MLNAVKDVPCADCGKRYPHYVMDFDHVRGKKEFSIYRARQITMCRKRLAAEIEKCEVVCSNCHRQRTHERNPTPAANA